MKKNILTNKALLSGILALSITGCTNDTVATNDMGDKYATNTENSMRNALDNTENSLTNGLYDTKTGMYTAENGVKNGMYNLENTVENGMYTTENIAKNGMYSTENAIKNGTNDLAKGVENVNDSLDNTVTNALNKTVPNTTISDNTYNNNYGGTAKTGDYTIYNDKYSAKGNNRGSVVVPKYNTKDLELYNKYDNKMTVQSDGLLDMTPNPSSKQ